MSYQVYQITEAAEDVLQERLRQKSAEGWTFEHDDSHVNGELAGAASAYAMAAAAQAQLGGQLPRGLIEPPPFFMFARERWEPKDQRANLVRAAALIIAEIERLDRAGRA